MGNCQAIDAATILIQHPSGKVDTLFFPVTASQVMKTNPGHYVALLISTTLCPDMDKDNTSANKPLRVTRIKLLRPSDTLALGQLYRLITAQDVMKGLGEKKQAKMKKALSETLESATAKSEMEKQNHQVTRHERHRQSSTTSTPTSSGATARPRTWQPSLHSITEATS